MLSPRMRVAVLVIAKLKIIKPLIKAFTPGNTPNNKRAPRKYKNRTVTAGNVMRKSEF